MLSRGEDKAEALNITDRLVTVNSGQVSWRHGQTDGSELVSQHHTIHRQTGDRAQVCQHHTIHRQSGDNQQVSQYHTIHRQ